MNLLVPVPVPDARVRVPSVSEALKMERAFGIRSLVRSPLHRRLAGDGAGCYESNYTLGGAKRGLLRPSSLARSLSSQHIARIDGDWRATPTCIPQSGGGSICNKEKREGGRKAIFNVHSLSLLAKSRRVCDDSKRWNVARGNAATPIKRRKRIPSRE